MSGCVTALPRGLCLLLDSHGFSTLLLGLDMLVRLLELFVSGRVESPSGTKFVLLQGTIGLLFLVDPFLKSRGGKLWCSSIQRRFFCFAGLRLQRQGLLPLLFAGEGLCVAKGNPSLSILLRCLRVLFVRQLPIASPLGA
jgi:hypothetical protein